MGKTNKLGGVIVNTTTEVIKAQSAAEKELERKLRNEWATPTKIFGQVCERWGIMPTIDVAANQNNTKCATYINEETNALKTDWLWVAAQMNVAPNFFMNPPFNPTMFMTKFIEQAIAVSERGGHTLFILPASVEQKWYHKLIKQYPHEFFEGRVNYEPPPFVKPSSARFNSMHGVITKPQAKIVVPELKFGACETNPVDPNRIPTLAQTMQQEFPIDWGSLT